MVTTNSIKNIKAIFTLPNADSGSDNIIKMIKKFVKLNQKKYIERIQKRALALVLWVPSYMNYVKKNKGYRVSMWCL